MSSWQLNSVWQMRHKAYNDRQVTGAGLCKLASKRRVFAQCAPFHSIGANDNRTILPRSLAFSLAQKHRQSDSAHHDEYDDGKPHHR